jgi:hypothetical protein
MPEALVTWCLVMRRDQPFTPCAAVPPETLSGQGASRGARRRGGAADTFRAAAPLLPALCGGRPRTQGLSRRGVQRPLPSAALAKPSCRDAYKCSHHSRRTFSATSDALCSARDGRYSSLLLDSELLVGFSGRQADRQAGGHAGGQAGRRAGRPVNSKSVAALLGFAVQLDAAYEALPDASGAAQLSAADCTQLFSVELQCAPIVLNATFIIAEVEAALAPATMSKECVAVAEASKDPTGCELRDAAADALHGQRAGAVQRDAASGRRARSVQGGQVALRKRREGLDDQPYRRGRPARRSRRYRARRHELGRRAAPDRRAAARGRGGGGAARAVTIPVPSASHERGGHQDSRAVAAASEDASGLVDCVTLLQTGELHGRRTKARQRGQAPTRPSHKQFVVLRQ